MQTVPTPEYLRELLARAEFASNEHASPFQKRAYEYIIWYIENHTRFGRAGIDKRVEFLDMAVGGAMTLFFLANEEIRALRRETPAAQLILPPTWNGGMSVVTKYRKTG